MTTKPLVTKLQQAIGLLEECLAEIGEKASGHTVGSKPSPRPSRVITLAQHLMVLRNRGFFAQEQTTNDTHQTLSTTYHCEYKRVGVELIRLQKKGELRKTSKMVKGKRLVAYVW